MNMDNILYTVKKALGGEMLADAFDEDLIMYINSVFTILDQLGVILLIRVIDKTTTWEQAIKDIDKLESVKSYVSLKVKFIFDPPTGAAMDALEKMISEFEYRIRDDIEVNFKLLPV